MKKKYLIVVFLIYVMILSAIPLKGSIEAEGKDGSFGGGSGTVSDPYIIEDVWDLQAIKNNLKAHYVINKDINASTTKSWNSGTGFRPIGLGNRFWGSLNGKNHSISNLFIDWHDESGLFGHVGTSGMIFNVRLENITVIGNNYIGGLVGINSGTVTNCFTSGTVIGNIDVGGLVGYNLEGMINNSKTMVTINGGTYLGGLVGYNYKGSINNSDASVAIIGSFAMGGIVGINVGSIINSYAIGNIEGDGQIGGIAGINKDEISHSYFQGILSVYQEYIGGLVGANWKGSISNCHSVVNVSGKGIVGGLTGENNAFVLDCSIIGNVYGAGGHVGGLAGLNNGEINRCNLKGNVNGTGGYIGGLVGESNGKLMNSFLKGNVSGAGSFIGGVVGFLGGVVKNSHYNIDTTFINGKNMVTLGGLYQEQYCDWFNNDLSLNISDYSNVLIPSGDYYIIESTQGLKDLLGFADSEDYRYRLGYDIDISEVPGYFIPYFSGELDGNNKTISNLKVDLPFAQFVGFIGINWDGVIYNIGIEDVKITGSYIVGGLLGINAESGSVSNAYVTGTVIGINSFVGGMIGMNWGTVENSYSAINVIGNYYVGGFVGSNYGRSNISYCHAMGKVKGNASGSGFASVNNGMIYKSFWDKEKTGQNSSSGGTGKTTAEMMTERTFADAGWNFEKVWCILENVTYPYLQWQDSSPPVANAGPDQNIDEGSIVHFNGNDSYDDIAIIRYVWSFNDGEDNLSLYGINPSYQFKNPGSFSVTLNVTDPSGNWETDIMYVTVNDITSPFAYAGSDENVNEGDTVTFDGSLSRDNVGIINYTWSFTDRDLIILYGIDPSYLFNHPGVFIVTLNVSDVAGHWATDSITVNVMDITVPVADAGTNRIVDEGTVVIFYGRGSYDNVGIINYTWMFLDGDWIVLYGADPIYLFNDPGILLVTLNVSDAAGHWATDSITVTVMDITVPVANAGSDRIIDQGNTVIFDGTFSSDNVGIANLTWTFIDVDLVVLYGVDPSYQFNTPGVFEVTLNVTDTTGNWATATMRVTVRDMISPVANAGSDQRIAIGSTVVLNGKLSTDNGIISRYTWTFTYKGEKKVLEGEEVSFKFDEAGMYNIILSVYDLADNYGDNNVVITVIDTGNVKGKVLDDKGDPVEGALIEITASNGEIQTVKTGSDGSFSIEVHHGSFTWKITKDGYKPISGTGSVNALEETEIDLSRSPLTREVEAKMILYLILFVIMILIVIGIAIFLFTRKKKEEPEEEKENTEDPSVEDKEADPSSERSMPLGSPELTPPPPVLDEEKPEDGPALEEEGSESIDDLLKDFYPDPEQIEEER